MTNLIEGPEDDHKVKYVWDNFEAQDIEPFYVSLGKKDSSTVRVFNRVGCFTLFGADAIFIGINIRRTTEMIRNYNASDESGRPLVPYVNLSEVQFNALIKELLTLYNMKIQMYNKVDGWNLEYEASPGNLPEQLENLFRGAGSHLDAKGVMAVHFNSQQLNSAINLLAKEISSGGGQTFTTASNNQSDLIPFSIAYIDTLSKQIRVTSSMDHPVHLSSIESLMVQLAPREVIVSESNECLLKRLKEIAPPFISHIESVRSTTFDSSEIRKRLPDYVLKNEIRMIDAIFDSFEEKGQTLTLQALSAAVDFLKLDQNSSNFNQFDIQLLNLSDLIRLDAAAVSSLNLFICRPHFGSYISQDNTSTVFGLLNHCKTTIGQRLLSQWVRQPLYNLEKLLERQECVDFFVRNSDSRSSLQPKLNLMPDLSRLARKLIMQTTSLTDLYSMHMAYNSLIDVIRILENAIDMDPNTFIKKNFVDQFKKCREELDGLEEIIIKVLDLKYYADSKKDLRIKASYDEELASLQTEQANLEKQLEKLIANTCRDTGNDSVKLGQTSEGHHYFYCTKKAEAGFISAGRKYQSIPSTKKDQARYTSDGLEKLNPKIVAITNKYHRREGELMKIICENVADFSSHIRSLNDLLASLDVFISLATAAIHFAIPWVRPKLEKPEKKVISFKSLRHPCVEADVTNSISQNPYIPNDVNLSEKRLLILTGPNMGGKSTYIRSVGIAVLLAQIGSFVPADEATVSIVDGIYTRIGAGDRQLQGNSTFMAEMVETSSILRSATDRSLIMIDELGRGTSTYDGFGIAWAVARHIATQIKSFCLFASHFFELTKLEDEVDSVGNLNVSVYIDPETQDVKMTYQIKNGPCLKSYGVIMAKSADFPDEIIAAAEEKLKDLECDFDGKRVNAKQALEKLKTTNFEDVPDDKIEDMVTSIILKCAE